MAYIFKKERLDNRYMQCKNGGFKTVV